MIDRSHKFFWGFLAALLLSFNLLLASCSSTDKATPNTSSAVSLPPMQITDGGETQVGTPTTFAISNVTSTPVVLATKGAANGSTSSNPTVVPTGADAGSTPDVISSLTPTVGPSPTPTLEGALVKVDKNYELKLIKTAYDDLLAHLFKAPDTAKLLTAALTEVTSVTNQPLQIPNFTDNSSDNWNKFTTAFNKIVDNAVATNFNYPKGQLGHRAINAMADAVQDEHTSFMSKDDYTQRNRLLQGDNSNVGFGIVFTIGDAEQLYIVRVIPGSPAEKGGLKAGDQIIRFDNEDANSKTRNTIRASVSGSTHTFTIKRPGQTILLNIKATKGQYTMPTVEYRLINKHIGYIAIRDFFTDVASETDKAMSDLYKQGANAWIIDVRDNPGGVNAEEVVGRFVKGGEVMGYDNNRKESVEDKVSNAGVNGPNNGKPFVPLLPLVLLVDQGSASSSEIFALAVRDFKLGTIIGDKTSGALGHTSAFPLGDETAITITVDEYVSVKQEKMNGIGVTPDILVAITPNDYANNRDPQLIAAVNEVEKTLARTASGH